MFSTSEYAQRLRSADLRVTDPRVAVLEAVPANPHADTDTIFGAVRTSLPDVIYWGLCPGCLLNGVAADLVTSGLVLAPSSQFALTPGPVLEVVTVQHPDAHLKFVTAIYRRKIKALQLVWAARRSLAVDPGLGRWPRHPAGAGYAGDLK